MSRFLVTGLPRSRTAWFAVATSALHEPISLNGPGWLSEWHDGGVSDSGAAPYLGFILDRIGPKTLIIERPREDVLASLVTYFGRPDLERQIDELLAPFLRGLEVESPLIRRVAFGDLANLETVEACLDWLEVTPPKNLAQMQHMVINSARAYTMSIVQQRAA